MSSHTPPVHAETVVRIYVISDAVAGLGGGLTPISTQVISLDSLSFKIRQLIVSERGALHCGVHCRRFPMNSPSWSAYSASADFPTRRLFHFNFPA